MPPPKDGSSHARTWGGVGGVGALGTLLGAEFAAQGPELVFTAARRVCSPESESFWKGCVYEFLRLQVTQHASDVAWSLLAPRRLRAVAAKVGVTLRDRTELPGYMKILYVGLTREQHWCLKERGQLEPALCQGRRTADDTTEFAPTSR